MASDNPNQDLLDEIKGAGVWFRAKKVASIWVKKLATQQVVQTAEGETLADAGDYICRGPSGDLWPQSADSIDSKYQATGETDDGGWQKFKVRKQNAGVMAARMDRSFRVVTSWGELSGKTGDYVVKNYKDKDVPYPDDVWIVDQQVFAATYVTSQKGCGHRR